MPPRFVVPAAPKCPRCTKSVYSAEQVIGPNGSPWHKSCYTCRECNRRLDSSILAEHEGDAYCNNCHKAKYGPTGYGYATGVLVRETPENEFKQNIGRPVNSGNNVDSIARNYTGGSSSGRQTDIDSPQPASAATTADEDEDARRREQLIPVNATLKKRSSLDMIREQAEASRRAYDDAHAQRVATRYGRVKADSTGGSTASTTQPPSTPATKTLFLNKAYKPSPSTPDPESDFAKSRQALAFQTGTPSSSQSTPPAPPSLPRRQLEPARIPQPPSSHGSEADTESYMDYMPIRVVARKDGESQVKEPVQEHTHKPDSSVTSAVDEDEWDEPQKQPQEPAYKPTPYRTQTQKISPQPTPATNVNRLISETDKLSLREQEERRQLKESSVTTATTETDEWDEEPTPNVPSKPQSMNYQPARHVSPAATRTWTPTASSSDGVQQPVSSNISTSYSHSHSHSRVSSGGSSGYASTMSQSGYTSPGASSATATASSSATATAAASSPSTTTPKTSYYRSGGLMTPKKMPMTFGGGDICPRCQKTVYAAESALAPGGGKYHKLCLRCMECSKSLDSTNITDRQGEILCKTCYGKKYGAKGYGYGSGASMLHTEL
ncbi:hypothetical protein BGZ92_009666 [Podila epicladia]|nr:hypothetical protein BGZ92_009666 [Podila epicladia]